MNEQSETSVAKTTREGGVKLGDIPVLKALAEAGRGVAAGLARLFDWLKPAMKPAAEVAAAGLSRLFDWLKPTVKPAAAAAAAALNALTRVAARAGAGLARAAMALWKIVEDLAPSMRAAGQILRGYGEISEEYDRCVEALWAARRGDDDSLRAFATQTLRIACARARRDEVLSSVWLFVSLEAWRQAPAPLAKLRLDVSEDLRRERHRISQRAVLHDDVDVAEQESFEDTVIDRDVFDRVMRSLIPLLKRLTPAQQEFVVRRVRGRTETDAAAGLGFDERGFRAICRRYRRYVARLHAAYA